MTDKELKKENEELKKALEMATSYVAFVYGAASAGDPMAIKLVKLYAKEDELTYTLNMSVKP